MRRERKDDAGWMTLPAEGRKEPAPDWPLSEPSERELELWRIFWAKPQAVLWEKNGQLYEVGMYVRTFVEAEYPDAAVTLRSLARQQADALLLTIPAMRQARVKIAQDEVAERRATTQAGPAEVAEARSSTRNRLRRPASGAS